MTIKIAIGCQTYLFGEGLKRLLSGEKGIRVIGIFDEGTDMSKIAKMGPDVVILDSYLFRGLPEHVANEAKMKILLVGDSSSYAASEKQISDLVAKGVAGFLPPSADSYLLKKAVRVVASGELWLDRKTMSNILSTESLSRRMEVKLTKTEKEIVSLVCQGYRNKEIGQKLKVSEKTVKSHCNRIFKKVGVADRLQLAIYVYKLWPDWYQMRH